jgi:hypothetical protein
MNGIFIISGKKINWLKVLILSGRFYTPKKGTKLLITAISITMPGGLPVQEPFLQIGHWLINNVYKTKNPGFITIIINTVTQFPRLY